MRMRRTASAGSILGLLLGLILILIVAPRASIKTESGRHLRGPASPSP